MSSDEDERADDPFKGFRYFKAPPPARVNDDTDTDTDDDELFILKGDADYQQMSAYQKGLEAQNFIRPQNPSQFSTKADGFSSFP